MYCVPVSKFHTTFFSIHPCVHASKFHTVFLSANASKFPTTLGYEELTVCHLFHLCIWILVKATLTLLDRRSVCQFLIVSSMGGGTPMQTVLLAPGVKDKKLVSFTRGALKEKDAVTGIIRSNVPSSPRPTPPSGAPSMCWTSTRS
jgi:hypothetical protein